MITFGLHAQLIAFSQLYTSLQYWPILSFHAIGNVLRKLYQCPAIAEVVKWVENRTTYTIAFEIQAQRRKSNLQANKLTLH